MILNYKTPKGFATVIICILKPCPSMIQKSCSNIDKAFVHDELLLFLGNCTTLLMFMWYMPENRQNVLQDISSMIIFVVLDCNFKSYNLHIAFHSFLYVIIMEWQLCCNVKCCFLFKGQVYSKPHILREIVLKICCTYLVFRVVV